MPNRVTSCEDFCPWLLASIIVINIFTHTHPGAGEEREAASPPEAGKAKHTFLDSLQFSSDKHSIISLQSTLPVGLNHTVNVLGKTEAERGSERATARVKWKSVMKGTKDCRVRHATPTPSKLGMKTPPEPCTGKKMFFAFSRRYFAAARSYFTVFEFGSMFRGLSGK